MYFSASCTSRGFTDRAVICPKLGSAILLATGLTAGVLLAGLPNCGWFNRLKNSARNCTCPPSWMPPTRTLFMTVTSKLNCPGPRIGPIPILPHPEPTLAGIVGSTLGIVVNGLAAPQLKYPQPPLAPPNRWLTGPGDAISA